MEEPVSLCGLCRHWLPLPQQMIGSCKRYPPVPVGGSQVLPQMAFGDWCGEFKPLEREDAE